MINLIYTLSFNSIPDVFEVRYVYYHWCNETVQAESKNMNIFYY